MFPVRVAKPQTSFTLVLLTLFRPFASLSAAKVLLLKLLLLKLLLLKLLLLKLLLLLPVV
jgi:hypothetical protein